MVNLRYYDLFSKLKFVTRFSGQNLIQPEKLESHILEMVGLTLDLHRGVGGFDLDRLIYLVLVHDVDEALTVDIPRPFKYFSDEFRKVYKDTVSKFLLNEGFEPEFITTVQEAKEHGLEGKLLGLIDLYQVKLKLELERSLGNSNLTGQIHAINGQLVDLYKDSDLKNYIEFLGLAYED